MPYPTLREISGVPEVSEINPNQTAILFIDFQMEYFEGRLPIPKGMSALSQAVKLRDWAQSADIARIHVQHVFPAGSPVFGADSPLSAFHSDLSPLSGESVVRKDTVSVFASTDLDNALKAKGITTLIISGLMTHACVAGAARDAVPLGFQVLVVEDACATRDISGVDGRVVPHESLHEAALVSVMDTFGDVLRLSDLMAMPLRAA